MSKVTLAGYNSASRCGYCKHDNSCSYGLSCNLMRASDYEGLMLKGWRRCGNYYYKPDIAKSCCKLNTIRCGAYSFVPNKSQKKVMTKFTNFIEGVKSESNNKAKRKQNKLEVPKELQVKITAAVKQTIEGIIDFSEDYVRVTRNIPARCKQFGDYSINSCIIICSRNIQLNLPEILEKLIYEVNLQLENTQ